MASIQTGIELYDGFSAPMMTIMSAATQAISVISDLQTTMNESVSPTMGDDITDQMNQAIMAVNELEQAMSELTTPAVSAPQVDTGTDRVINVSVNPVIPDPLVENPEPIRPEIQPNAPPDPVEVPIEWQTDNLDVFTSSGLDRFQQEVQSANTMLEQLSSTQDAIARQAYNTTIFPPEAFQNLNSMAVRIDTIKERIQQIENNRLNFGTDTANNELEQLRGQLSQAISEQTELNTAMQNMDVSAANDAYLRLNQTVSGTERYIRDEVNEQGRFNREIEQGVDAAGDLKSMISGAIGAFAGIAGIRKAISWIDECTDAFDTQRNAELQLMTVLANTLDEDYVSQFTVETAVTADTSEAVAEINDIQNQVDDVTVVASANTQALESAFDTITQKAAEIQSNGIYGDEAMIAGAAEFSTYFTDTDAIEMMMDTLADYAMGMSGGGEIDSTAMVDYATGLGKIMTGSYDAMTKKGFEFTDIQKDIIEGTATQAQIAEQLGEEYVGMSEDMQAAAVISQVIGESWDGLYESMSNTPEGKIIQMTNAWGDMKEVIGGQLYPYVILFVDAITENWGTIQTIVNGITAGLQVMMGVLSWLLEGALNFAQVVIDNWSWISPIIYGVVAALAVYGAYLAITKGIELASAAASAVHSLAMSAKIGVTAALTGSTMAATAAQMGYNGALYACPLAWIIMLIIALVAVIFAVCNAIANMTGVASSGFGVMTGGVNVVIQFFKNLGLTVANIALGIGNAIAALASNMMTAFNNAICNIQSWFYNLLSTALTVVAGICEALNNLPFVEFDYSGITSAASDYAAKAAEAADNKEDYTSVADAFNEGMSTFDTFQDGWASDAFAAGAAWGDGIADKVSSFSLSDLFNTTDVPSVEDYASSFGDAMDANGLADNVDSVAGNTGSIADSLDVTEEDLKYLRDIAEQEAVNRFTIAEVKVEQTNHNNISSGMDLDGVVSGLTDAVNEAVDSITEGVHK